MSELKPCPFCGGVAEMKRQGNDYTKKRRIVVRCPACRLERADAAIHHSMEWLEGVATKNWNHRPIEDALRAEVAVLREQRDHKFEQFLDWRGIEVGEQCDRCQGAGSYMYSSTATWMGGIGGQAMTVGVCNKCWGSGKKNSPWTNLRDVMQIRREIAALKDERDECALGVMTASERAGRYANQIASLKAAKARAAEAFPAVIPFIGADDDGYACNAAMEVLSAYFAEEAGDD